jgi:hypothetical protein
MKTGGDEVAWSGWKAAPQPEKAALRDRDASEIAWYLTHSGYRGVA